MNTITVIGNVGKDPELRYTKSGNPIVKFTLADTRGKDENKTTTWHNVTVFEEQAENVVEQVKKGSRVLVVGRLQKESYVDKDGNKRESVEIVADDVCLSLKWKAKAKSTGSAMTEWATDEEPF